MNTSSEQIRSAIAVQAADWFVENSVASPDGESRGAFCAWLKASPLHVEEYLGIALITRHLTSATSDPEFQLDSLLERARGDDDTVVSLGHAVPQSVPAAARLRLRRAGSYAVAAAVLLIAVAATAIWSTRDGERFGLPRTYSTAHGERRIQQLPDGSVLQLNTDSQVTVRYTRRERIVDLDHGEALFQVAHEGARRFRVPFGEAGTIAIGTRFDVYRRPATTSVTVINGTVLVYTGALQLGVPSEQHVRVGAGYQVDVSRGISVPQPIDPRGVIAWLRGQIVFENRALGEVAAEFNRYGSIRLEIDDRPLSALPISGVFDAYDTDSFAAFLETLNGVVVQKTPTAIRVRSLAAASREPLSVAR